MPERKASQSQRFREEALNEKCEISMTPMIDCVFQLLIFFMLACRFRTSEGKLSASLPKDSGRNTRNTPPISLQQVRVKLLWVEPNSFRETKDPNNGRVLLKVSDGNVERNFKWAANQYGESLPDYDELCRFLVRKRDLFKPTKSFPALPVIIDARSLVPFKHIVHALNTCVKAKLKNITFAAPEIPY